MRWYYSVAGKAEGPVTKEFLIEQLKAGTFTLVDLVFREGESAWKTFGEIPEFREAFKAVPAFVPPAQVSSPEVMSTTPQEITLDDLTFDDEPKFKITQADPHPISSFLTPDEVSETKSSEIQPAQMQAIESTIAKSFVKPEEGWPSDWRLSSSWIVLKKRADGSGYDQEGPYSAEVIIEMIGRGQIEYSQYCWKPGYTRWFRIGNLPEFDRRKRDRENDTVNQIIPIPALDEALPALTREELLANVEKLRREKRAHDPAPSEATGRNLIETSLDHVPNVQREIEEASVPSYTQPAKPAVEPVNQSVEAPVFATDAPPSVLTEITPKPPSQKTKPLSNSLRLVVAALIALIVVAALYQILSSRHREPASSPATLDKKTKPISGRIKTSLSEPRQMGPSSTAGAAATAPANTNTIASAGAGAPDHPAPTQASAVARPEATKSASSLEILPLDLETPAAHLEFKTDMAPSEKITVKIKAHTGEILALGNFSKTFEVTAPAAGAASSRPTLDLGKQLLPFGSYFVEAQVGSAQTSTQIFLGKRDDAFTRELERHLKSLSLRQQSEKSALFYGSQALEKLSKRLLAESAEFKTQPAKWKKAFQIWRAQAREAALPVITLSKAPPNEQTFPEQISEFQSATDRLAAQAKEIDAAISQKRDVASNASTELSFDFGKLKDESAKLTGRPHAPD